MKKSKFDITTQWDEIFRKESSYSELPEPMDIVKAIIKFKKTGMVLDLGAGNSGNALFLAKKGFNVVGVDISEAGIRLLEESANNLGVQVKGIVGDIAQFEFDRKYDVMLSLGVLNLLPKEEAMESIQKMKMNTENQGLDALLVFTEDVPLEDVFFLFKHNELKNLYNDWEIIEYREYLTPLHKGEREKVPHRHANAVLLARKI